MPRGLDFCVGERPCYTTSTNASNFQDIVYNG